jgi:peptide/nickel transport system permease protein
VSVAELEAREVTMEAPAGGLWSDAWRRLRRNPGAIVGFAMVTIFVFIAIFAPLIAPYSPTDQNLAALHGTCCPGPARRIRSGSTTSVATSSRGSSTVRATRS